MEHRRDMPEPRPSGADWRAPERPAPAVIEGRYLRMEPLAAGHAAALHAANAADDAIWAHLAYGPFAREADYAAWVAAVAGRPDPMFFALVDRETGLPGGVASLMRITPEHGVAEVGHICLSPRMQRTRAASEMVFLLAERLFAAGYRRLDWKCDARNLPSRRAAQRFGFAFEGVFRNHMVVKGRNRDTAWFAMTDGDWDCLVPAWREWLDPANFDAGGQQRQRLGTLTGRCRAASDPALGT
jgi:RimJ/RimL family protein N-acetyltransferase